MLIIVFFGELRFTSQSHPVKLTDPLGEWTALPNQRWSHYYDTTTDKIEWALRGKTTDFVRDVYKSIYRHQAFHCSHTRFLFNIGLASIVPAIIKHHPRCTATFSVTRKVPDPLPTLQFSQKSYFKSLPRYLRRLLSWWRLNPNSTSTGATTLLLTQLCRGRSMEIGSDGGLNSQGGSFGFVVGITGKALWNGAGPFDGAPSCSSSTHTLQIIWIRKYT